MCCGTTTGLRISTILALLTSLTLTLYSAYLFQGHYQDKHSQSTRALDAVTGIANKSLTTELNIKLFCTGAVAVGAGLQFLGSLAVLICAGRNSSKLLLVANTLIFFLLISVIACYLTARVDYEHDEKVQFFLGGCGLDLLILIYASCVAGVFLRN